MPSWPAGATLCTVTLGPLLGSGGTPGNLTGWLELDDPDRKIVHESTGTTILSAPEQVPTAAGNQLSFTVPHVDQAGFIDGTGAAITMWGYKLTVTAKYPGGKKVTYVKNFQPLVGQATLDLDNEPDGEFTDPVLGPGGFVSSVAGLGPGVVAADDLAGALETDLSAMFARQGGSTGLVLDVLTGAGAAIGDGVTDDTAALQAKIDAAAAWGGAVLIGEHAITASLTLPANVRLVGRNDDSRLHLPAGANFPAVLVDGTARARVERLRVTAAGATASGAAAVKARGATTDLTVIGVTAESIYDGFAVEGSEGTPGTAERVTLIGCHASDSDQYGYRFGDVDGLDLIGCRSVGSGLDGVKLSKSVHNWTLTGGLYTGAVGGDGLDAYAGGGDFTIQGGVFSGNALNGIVIKCDDLNLSDPANYGWVRNGNVANVQASDNGGSGLTIHRNNGDVDDTTEPLVQSITVNGGIFNGNANYGVFVNARQVSLMAPQAKRNGLDGIRVQSTSLDVDIVAPHVAGNSRTASGARDGIYIAGKRVKVWGGSSHGSDPDGAKNDADITAGTKTQRYGIRVEATASGCVVGALSLRNNITGDRSDLSADTVWFNNPSDAASAPVLVMPNNQRIFGRKADGTQLSLMYVTTGGGINVGDAAASMSFLGTGSTTFFPKVNCQGEVEIEGALNHDGTTVGFYGATPVTKPTALTAANGSALNTGDATSDTVIANMRTRINELEAKIQSLGLLA